MRIFPHAQPLAQETMADETQSARADEILSMFARVPIEQVEAKMMELWNAKRTVSMGRDRAPVEEPDTAIQYKVWEVVATAHAGKTAQRKPVEPKQDKGKAKVNPASKSVAD